MKSIVSSVYQINIISPPAEISSFYVGLKQPAYWKIFIYLLRQYHRWKTCGSLEVSLHLYRGLCWTLKIWWLYAVFLACFASRSGTRRSICCSALQMLAFQRFMQKFIILNYIWWYLYFRFEPSPFDFALARRFLYPPHGIPAPELAAWPSESRQSDFLFLQLLTNNF